MTNQQSSFKLNPSANEFVPSFALNSTSISNTNTYSNNSNNNSYNPSRQSYHNNHYQHHNNHHYNNNNNNRHYNNNQHYNRNHNKNYNNNYNNNYNGSNSLYNSNQLDVDPFELEARCEAVVEILQDDRVREQLNPVGNEGQFTNQTSGNCEENVEQCDDEEEMLEMMAMQEECRLEMMKFYIQSQNPNLFEEIYHDVSYPDKPLEPKQPNKQNNKNETSQQESTDKLNNVKESIVNGLDTTSSDYVPSKMAELSLNDEKKN